MSQEIRIPDIGDAEDVEVVEILVSAGDQVNEDDPVIVIESDKASMEVPAGVGGTIDSVTVAVGDKVNEGQVIARLKASSGSQQPPDGEASGADGGVVRDQDAAPAESEAAADEGTAAAEGQAAADESTAAAEGQAAADESTAAAEDEAAADEGTAAAEDEAAPPEELEVRVPDVGEAENVEVIEVAVKAGDHVGENDLLVVVESDKASMEIPSPHAGTVKQVHVSVGTQVDEGTPLATLLLDRPVRGGKAAPANGSPAEAAPTASSRADAKPAEPEAQPAEAEAQPAEVAQPSPPGSGAGIYAGPAVRRLARELGVDLTAVSGTGNRGRIVKDDVKAHVKSRMTAGPAAAGGAAMGGVALPALPEVDFSRFGDVEKQPLSRIRAKGAENLHRSWINLPHVTQHDEVDITDLEDFRASLKAEGERRGIRVTPLAFIIKACCQVLKEFPTVNASLDPAATTFILKRYYHIGMAVDTPDGLVVPVIRDADGKGVWELSAEIAELAAKARDKKLAVADLQGGSFSVSSLGAIGGTGFTPIINAPEVAILGVSRVTMRPVWRADAFVPRKMLPVSLSYDHRAINGAEAGRFVVRLGELLSDIRRLAL